MVIHDLDGYSAIEKSDLLDIGVKIHPDLKGKKLNIYDVASYNADAILIIDRPGKKISTRLLKKTAFKNNKKKITIFDEKDTEQVDYGPVSKSLNQIISDLSSK